jgi:glycogen debranching enzyme
MGRFSEWEAQLQSQVQLGYRAFHFPPIQQLGESGSLYAIKDQLRLNSEVFSGATLADLKKVLGHLHEKGVLFFVDTLLNHTSFDSEWLNDN